MAGDLIMTPIADVDLNYCVAISVGLSVRTF